MVARLGGEEFVALLIHADIKQATRICDRVRREFGSEGFSFADGPVLHVTVSAGLAPITAGTTLDDILRVADMALYRAKDDGRDRLTIAA